MASTSPTNISLHGWDTANVTTFDVMNASIKSQGKTPAKFAFTSGDPISQPSVSGLWDAWSLVPGGAGQTLLMSCPVKSGSAVFASTMNTMPVFDASTAGASLKIAASGLVVTNSATSGDGESVLGNVGRTSGKYYFEITLGAATTGKALIGIARSAAPGLAFTVNTPGAFAYRNDGHVVTAGRSMAFPGGAGKPWSSGDTVGVAADLDAGKVWFRGPDGSWQGASGADPVTGTSAAYTYTPNATTPMFLGVALEPGVSLTANFGATPLKNPAPAGFSTVGTVFTTVALDGCAINAQISLTNVSLTGGKTGLMADPSGTPASPAVTVMSLVAPSGSKLSPQQIQQATLTFGNVLNNDIGGFKNVFHTLDFNSALANSKLAWLNPTDTQYAVADAAKTPTTSTSVFALLSMTEMRDDSMLTPQIEPTILDGLSSGANSVFALSAERFTAKILLGVAMATLIGSQATDFSFDTTGLVISNLSDLPWREIELADGSKVTPAVPAGGLKIQVVDNHIELEFTGAHFDVPGWAWPGHKIATLQFTQHVFLKLVSRTDAQGNTVHYLLARNVDPNSGNAQAIKDDLPTIINPVVNVSFDKTAITFQDAMIGISIALSVLTVGLVAFSAARWIIRAPQVAQGAANAANAGNAGIALNQIYGPPPAVLAAQAAANAAGSGCVACDGILFVTKIAIATTIATVITGAAMGTFWAIYKNSTATDLADGVVANLPAAFTVEALLTEVFQAYDWTGTGNSWAVVDARLAQSLLIYGKLS